MVAHTKVGAILTSCRSDEVNWGCRTKGREGTTMVGFCFQTCFFVL